MHSQKFRCSKQLENDINLYHLNSDIPEKITVLMSEYQILIGEIVSSDKSKKQTIREKHEGRIKEIKSELDGLNNGDYQVKNVLSQSRNSDQVIGSGQDSHVYKLGNQYVYKEGKEGNERNLEYLKKKYLILRKFLGDIIPKSYFIYGESIDPIQMKGMGKYKKFSKKSITIQRKINGINAQQMSQEEKNNPIFLEKLEKAHKKYILLKFFIQSICTELGLSKKTLDSQLDLGSISKIDSLHIDNIDFIENHINSPNIMWDGKTENIYFIDFGSGEWDDEKEAIFQEMLKDSIFKKWNEICNHIGLE